MEQKKEAVFVDGMIFKKPKEGAPEFIKGHISIKAPELIAFLQKHAKPDGWVNIDMKKSQKGSLYFQLNDWTPPKKEDTATPPDDDVEIPF